MDRLEAVLLVAEAALARAKELEDRIKQLEAAPKRAVSFLIDESGVLRQVTEEGDAKPIGKVRPAGIKSVKVIDGRLCVTMTDGDEYDAGEVRGLPGKDGIDGIGPDDMSLTLMEDGRTVRFGYEKGGTDYAFQIPFPVMIYRGVWSDAQTYTEGDVCTWGGSLWHCDKSGAGKPDAGDWRLIVKKGRDGKDKA